jgi:hypothetical protein
LPLLYIYIIAYFVGYVNPFYKKNRVFYKKISPPQSCESDKTPLEPLEFQGGFVAWGGIVRAAF